MCVCACVCFVLFFCFFFGVANRHYWDADWSQVGNLEALIGSRKLYSDHALLLSRSLFSVELLIANCTREIMVLACQVGPFHLTLTQINSEMNCIAKKKCPESQELDETQRWELECYLFYTVAHNCHGKSKSLTAKAKPDRDSHPPARACAHSARHRIETRQNFLLSIRLI